MDAMALLCTLHADGPTTLKRLRQAGCDSIEAVAALDPDRLGALLGSTPAAARRFLREAAHLATRLDVGFLEREEKGVDVPAPGTTTESHAVQRSAESRDREGRDREQRDSESSASMSAPSREKHPTLGYRDQRIVEQVLQAWRKHDAEESGSSAGMPPPAAHDVGTHAAHGGAQRAARELGEADDGIAEAARAVHPEESGAAGDEASRAPTGADVSKDGRTRPMTQTHSGTPTLPMTSALPGTSAPASALTADLFPGAVDGLDQETCLRLRRAGIHDVEMLARVDPLALSKSLGVGYMRLARICALARRRVAHSSSAAAHYHSREPSAMQGGSMAELSSEAKFSRAGNPTIGVLPALAQDLETTSGPKPLLPSRTRWSPASAATSEGEESGGPFA